jgi:hypothetical protein
MSDEEGTPATNPAVDDKNPVAHDEELRKLPSPKEELLPLPGLAAISLYLVVLAVVIVVGVVGGHYPALLLVLPVFLFAASGGLLMRFRWAWAMALSAVLMLGGYNLWLFAHQHLVPGLIQGMLNMVFFFYLVRPEVREKLR